VWREIFGDRHGGCRRRTKQLSQIRNSPTVFSAAGLVVLELRLFIIVVQVALADYCFRVCLLLRTDKQESWRATDADMETGRVTAKVICADYFLAA